MVIQLQAEGIQSISDLVDFDKDSLQQLADSLCHPGGWVLAPSPGASVSATISTPLFVFGAKTPEKDCCGMWPCSLLLHSWM